MADKTLPPIAIGDSLAQGMRDANQLPGISRVGAGPKEVYEMLQRFATNESLAGRDVFIGTGMPNIPEQKKYIEQQIDFVRKQGGNPILFGVGPGTKKKPTTGQNEFLAGLAERKGLPYMGPLVNMFPDVTKDPMGLHLRGSQYKQLFKQYSKPSQAQPQTQQVQPQSRVSSAADLLSQFTGAVMQAESKGKRYDKSGKLLTSKAGALGEMQVMPGTITDPGYGVKPARDNSPEEIARVGRDYAAVMLRRYNNDPTAAAVAYNWGPGKADKWVKRGADFNALPKETQQYVTRITGQMGVPITAKRVPPPSAPPKRAEKPVAPRVEAPVDYAPGSTLEPSTVAERKVPRPADRPSPELVADLGPNYQAALAGAMLADDPEYDMEDDQEAMDRFMEQRELRMAGDETGDGLGMGGSYGTDSESTLEEDTTPSAPSLAGLSELSFKSPFPVKEEQPPVMMAEGGDARAMMDELEPTFGQKMGAALSDVGTKGLIHMYDAARLAEGALSSKEPEMSAAHKIYLDTFGFKNRRDPVTAEYFNPEEQKAIAELIAKKGGQRGSIQYKDYKDFNNEKRKIDPRHILAGKLDPYLSVSKALGQFNYEYDPKTKSYRVIDEYDFNPLVDVGGRQVSSDFMGDYLSDVPGLYNKARIYGGRHMPPGTGRKVDFVVPAVAPVKRADGSPIYGEGFDTGPITEDTRAAFANRQSFNPREALAALKRIAGEGVSNLESAGRRSVAGLPGTVGSIESIFTEDKDRRFATGEEIERQRLPKRMTTPTKEAAGFGEIGEFIDPTIALKAAPKIAKATLKALKESGPQVEKTLGKAVDPFGTGLAEPMSILRQTGGEFPTVRSINDRPISKFDNALASLYSRNPGPDYAPVTRFFDTKIRNYFKKEAGSVSDSVREGLISGRIKIPKDSPLEEMFPDALIKAARDGDITAMKLIEKELDRGTNIKGYKQVEKREFGADQIVSDEMRSAILQQMKNNPNIIPDAMLLRIAKKNASNLSPEVAAKTVADIRAKLKANPELFSTVYEEKIMRMMPDQLAEAIPPEYITKYPGLYKELGELFEARKGIMGLKGAAPVLDVDSPPKLLGMSFDEIHQLMQQIPEKELDRMDVPAMLNRVIQLDKVNNEAANYVKQAERLISAKKNVPEKISTFGTKPFTSVDNQGFSWREIVEPAATKIQGKLLNNSIGGYARPGSYGSLAKGRNALTNGEVRLFGLYDKNNQLMTNVEYITDKAGKLQNTIPQFFGNGPRTGNVAPENFVPQVEELINKLNPENIPPSIKLLLRDKGISFSK